MVGAARAVSLGAGRVSGLLCAAVAGVLVLALGNVTWDYARGEAAAPAGEFRQDVEGKRTFVTANFVVSFDKLGASLAGIGQTREPPYVRDIGLELERIRRWYGERDFRLPGKQHVRVVPVHKTRGMLDALMGNERFEVAGEAVPYASMMHIGCEDAGGRLFPIERLRTTLAHEYFHRIQQQYQVFMTPDAYLSEGSANLMEALVYPDQAEGTVRESGNMTPVLFDSVPLNEQADSAMAFFLFLSQKYGVALFRDIYEAYGGARNVFQTTWGAIEKAVGAREKGAGSMSGLFLEFADDFFTGNPPKHALYPILRTDRRGKNPLVKTQDIGRGPKGAVRFSNVRPFTADYVVCTSPGLVRVRGELVSSDGRAHVRLYHVGRDQTTYSCYLTRSQPRASGAIAVGPGTGIGLLFTNVGKGAGGGIVELTMEEVKTGFLQGDGVSLDPIFRADNPAREVKEQCAGTPEQPISNFQIWSNARSAKRTDQDVLSVCLWAYETAADLQKDFRRFSEENKSVRANNAAMSEPAGKSTHYVYEDRSRFTDTESVLNYRQLRYVGDRLDEERSVFDGEFVYRDRFTIRVWWMKYDTGENLEATAAPMIQRAKELIDLRYPDAQVKGTPVAERGVTTDTACLGPGMEHGTY